MILGAFMAICQRGGAVIQMKKIIKLLAMLMVLYILKEFNN